MKSSMKRKVKFTLKSLNPRDPCWISLNYAGQAEPVTFLLVLLHFPLIYW